MAYDKDPDDIDVVYPPSSMTRTLSHLEHALGGSEAGHISMIDMSRDPSQLERARGTPDYSYSGQSHLASSRAATPAGHPYPSSTHERETAALAPQDQGYAWVFLIAAFGVECLAWGYAFSVGVFHEYWTTELFPNPGDASTLTLASTLMTGVMYMTAVLASPLYTRYPEWRWVLQYGGLALSASGIIGSAFVTRPWQLLLTAGIMYPVGSCIYYINAATLLFEWFNRYRGFAGAVMYSGTGLGGAAFPFIIEALLRRYSYKAAVLSLAIGYGVIGSIALFFVRERIPVPKRLRNAPPAPRRKIPTTFLKRNTFYCFTGTILLTSLGNFLPSIFTVSFGSVLGYSSRQGTLVVAVMNAASVAGLLVLGYLSDRWSARVLIAISCFGAAFACLFLWGFATGLTTLMAFAIIFGFFGLGFAALWTKMISIIAKDDHLLPPILFSIFAFARGVGNVASGPIATALLQGGNMPGAKYGYGVVGYGGLLIYTGSIIAIGSLVGVSYRDR